MPNTLVHLGLQGLTTRALAPRAALLWAALGAVIPDLPWILQRVVRGVLDQLGVLDHGPIGWLYDLRLYAIVQASLLFCLLLALAAALLARERLLVFLVVGGGCALHLVLDAMQTKWGNGVHLLAPFDWHQLNLGWFWPESPLTWTLTGLGLILSLTLLALDRRPPGLVLDRGHCLTALVPVAVYLVAPIAFLSAAQATDSHSVLTLRAGAQRVGRAVAMHRVPYHSADRGGGVVRSMAEEELRVPALEVEDGARVSLRGRFIGVDEIEVDAWHLHDVEFRDDATYIGLALFAIAVALALRRRDAAAATQGQSSSRSSPSAERNR